MRIVALVVIFVGCYAEMQRPTENNGGSKSFNAESFASFWKREGPSALRSLNETGIARFSVAEFIDTEAAQSLLAFLPSLDLGTTKPAVALDAKLFALSLDADVAADETRISSEVDDYLRHFQPFERAKQQDAGGVLSLVGDIIAMQTLIAEHLAAERGHEIGLTRARLYFGVDQSIPTPHVDPGYLAVSTNLVGAGGRHLSRREQDKATGHWKTTARPNNSPELAELETAVFELDESLRPDSQQGGVVHESSRNGKPRLTIISFFTRLPLPSSCRFAEQGRVTRLDI